MTNEEIEALCAAAYDVDERNRRPVGLPAPVVRGLLAELRRLRAEHEALVRLGEARAAWNKALRAAANQVKGSVELRAAERAVWDLADAAARGGTDA